MLSKRRQPLIGTPERYDESAKDFIESMGETTPEERAEIDRILAEDEKKKDKKKHPQK